MSRLPQPARLPPHDLDAEHALLASAMLDPRLLTQSALMPQDFFSGMHARVWEAIQEVAAEGVPVDVVSVATKLRDRGRIDEVGGVQALTELLLTPAGVSEAAFTGFQETVMRHANARAVLRRIQLAEAQLYEGVINLVDWRSALAQDIATEDRASDARPVGFDEALKTIAARFWTPRERLKTGLYDLDVQIGGLFGGDLTVLAARPGMGKTSLAWQIAANVAKYEDTRAAFLSCEQPPEEIFGRALSGEAGVPFSKVRSGEIDGTAQAALVYASHRIREAMRCVDVFDLTQPSVEQVRSLLVREKARLARNGKKLGVVVIDYLQIMKMLNPTDRNGSVGHITATLKATAKELMLPIVLLSQLNRAVESRTDKRPTMGDLRDSGSIEQDADNILFIYREGYYQRQRTPTGPAEIDVAKCRNGEPGRVDVFWNGPRTRFQNLEHNG